MKNPSRRKRKKSQKLSSAKRKTDQRIILSLFEKKIFERKMSESSLQ